LQRKNTPCAIVIKERPWGIKSSKAWSS